MAENRLRSGQTTEDQAADGEEHTFQKPGILEWLRADAVVVSHFLEESHTTHLVLSEAHAEFVVAFVVVEEEDHGAETHEAGPAGDVEDDLEDAGDGDAGVEESVEARTDQDDVEVGGEEVGFEESVVEVEEIGPVDWFGWWGQLNIDIDHVLADGNGGFLRAWVVQSRPSGSESSVSFHTGDEDRKQTYFGEPGADVASFPALRCL